MPRTKRPRTDIPDWRDPEMPVERTIKRDGRLVVKQFEPAKVQQICEMLMHSSVPLWRDDPTYNMRKK